MGSPLYRDVARAGPIPLRTAESRRYIEPRDSRPTFDTAGSRACRVVRPQVVSARALTGLVRSTRRGRCGAGKLARSKVSRTLWNAAWSACSASRTIPMLRTLPKLGAATNAARNWRNWSTPPKSWTSTSGSDRRRTNSLKRVFGRPCLRPAAECRSGCGSSLGPCSADFQVVAHGTLDCVVAVGDARRGPARSLQPV